MSYSVSKILKLANKFEKKIAAVTSNQELNPKQKMKKIEGAAYVFVGTLYKEAPKALQLFNYLNNSAQPIIKKYTAADKSNMPSWIKYFDSGNDLYINPTYSTGIVDFLNKVNEFPPAFYQRRLQTPRQAFVLINEIATWPYWLSSRLEKLANDDSLAAYPKQKYAANQLTQSMKMIMSSAKSINDAILKTDPSAVNETAEEVSAKEKQNWFSSLPSYR